MQQSAIANTEVIYLLNATQDGADRQGGGMGGVNQIGEAMQAKTLAYLTKFNVFNKDDVVRTIRR